jgi:hypothetical protein
MDALPGTSCHSKSEVCCIQGTDANEHQIDPVVRVALSDCSIAHRYGASSLWLLRLHTVDGLWRRRNSGHRDMGRRLGFSCLVPYVGRNSGTFQSHRVGPFDPEHFIYLDIAASAVLSVT